MEWLNKLFFRRTIYLVNFTSYMTKATHKKSNKEIGLKWNSKNKIKMKTWLFKIRFNES